MTALTDALAHWQALRDAGRLDPFIDPLAEAARRVAQAPEWLQQLIEGGYQLASPTLGDVIVLKIPPNADGVLFMAEGLRDAFDRQVIVLEEGWDLDSPEVPSINICEVHLSPEATTEQAGVCWLYDGDQDCRMVRKLLVDPAEET